MKIFFLHQKGWGILQQVSDVISRVELHLLQRYERSNAAMSATASFSPVSTREALLCGIISGHDQVHDAAAAMHLIISMHFF